MLTRSNQTEQVSTISFACFDKALSPSKQIRALSKKYYFKLHLTRIVPMPYYLLFTRLCDSGLFAASRVVIDDTFSAIAEQ